MTMIGNDNDTGFELDDDDTADAFGPGAGHAASGDADFDEFDAPPTPIGVLPAFVKSAKKLEKDGKINYVIEFECTDPRFAAAEKVSLFVEMPRWSSRYNQVAAALGVTVPQVAGRIRSPKPETLANKQCMVVYSTYTDKRDGSVKSTIAWGLPKAGDSELFDEWARGLTEEQKNAIKKSPGVMPAGSF